MEGIPADLTVYKDTNLSNDHSYFGNGCDSEFSQREEIKSPCAIRIIQTHDGEDQKNGAYYNYPASTSGYGGESASTDNSNSPDTFCPLGWQLPYSGSGGDYYDKSKSWVYLFNKYGIVSSTQGAQRILSYPMSYINGGSYWHGGAVLYATKQGVYSSITINTRSHSYAFRMTNIWFNVAEANMYKPDMESIRCALIFSIHSSTARWREQI